MSDVEIIHAQEKVYHFGDVLVTSFLYGEKPKYVRMLKQLLEYYYAVASFEEEEETRTLRFVGKLLMESPEFLNNVIEFNDYGVGFKAEEVIYIDEDRKFNETEQTLWHIWDPMEIEEKYYGHGTGYEDKSAVSC